MSGLKNIAIVGGSGNLGAPTVHHLLASNRFTITAISRAESTATFPPGVNVVKGDYQSPDFLKSALAGQDALVLIFGFSSMDHQFIFLEAAAAAGVKWVLPTEFGSDTAHAGLNAVVPLFQLKEAARQKAEALGLTWIGLVTNAWFGFSLSSGLFEIDIAKKTATLYDDSEKFHTTLLPTAALALARVLSLPVSSTTPGAPSLEKYANKHVYVSSALLTQPEIFEIVKEATGTTDGEWEITHAKYADRLKRGADALAEGNHSGMVDLVYGIAMKPGFGGNYGETRGLDNAAFGLAESEDLVEAVKASL